MVAFVEFMAYPVVAKGLTPRNKMNVNRLQNHLFEEELFSLQKLKDLPTISLSTSTPILLYPGSGSDILYPLFFLENLFTNLNQVRLIFIDRNDSLPMIKSILNDLGISFSEPNNHLTFYWKHLLIELQFIVANIFNFQFPQFDIYFERKLAIFKERFDDYEWNIFNKLNAGGLIISDYGFKKFNLEKIAIPLELSAYNEMIIGRKSLN